MNFSHPRFLGHAPRWYAVTVWMALPYLVVATAVGLIAINQL